MHLTTPQAIIKKKEQHFNGVEFVNLTFITLHNRAEELALVTLQNVGILHWSEMLKLHQTKLFRRVAAGPQLLI